MITQLTRSRKTKKTNSTNKKKSMTPRTMKGNHFVPVNNDNDNDREITEIFRDRTLCGGSDLSCYSLFSWFWGSVGSASVIHPKTVIPLTSGECNSSIKSVQSVLHMSSSTSSSSSGENEFLSALTLRHRNITPKHVVDLRLNKTGAK